MTNAKGLIDEIRRELQSVEREIRDHSYLAELEAARVARSWEVNMRLVRPARTL